MIEGISPDGIGLSALNVGISPGDVGLLLLVFRARFIAHVRVHVNDEEIHKAVVVVVEKFDSHGAPRSYWEILVRFLNKLLATLVFIVVAVSLHVEEEDVGPAVAIKVAEGGVTAPAVWAQPYFRSHVPEPVVAQIPVKDGIFVAVRMQVPFEGVGYPDVLSVRSLLVGGILADIADQKVEQAVVVIVKKKCSRRVGDKS